MSIKNILKSYFSKPQNVIIIALLFSLSFLTLVPLLSLIYDTFVVHPSELFSIPGSQIGDFTLFHWFKVLFDGENSQAIFYEPIWNSIVVSFGSSLFAILLGGVIAWFVTRSNIRFKSLISFIFVFPYIMPSWTLALAWLNFFRNSLIGGAPGLFAALTGIEPPNWFAYGQFPITVVLGLHYAPFAYILIGGILRNMDANLEEAATILKTSRFKIIRKITLPIVLPAILSTFLLTFSSSMSAFAIPAFLGTQVRYQVLTTQIYRTMNGLNPGYGFIMAFILILMGTSILLLNQWFIGRRKSYTTITGKSSQISIVNLKKLRNPISIVVLLFLGLIAIVPIITFAVESFIVAPGNYSFSNFSTIFWIGEGSVAIGSSEPGILRNPNIYLGLWNSIRLSVLVALGAGTIGLLAGYAIVKTRGTKLSSFVNNLAFFPYLMPSLAFGAIYLSMFSTQDSIIPSLYGTFFLLVLIGTVKYLPFASRAGINAMLQLSNEIEEAAVIQGVGWFKRMTRIIIPIQNSTFMS